MAKRFEELHIAVLLGGHSAEREISLLTGEAVTGALRQLGLKPLVLDLDAETPQKLREAKVDFVFNALHGTLGEDGRVQGMLDILDIPYSGSGVLASALGMNKIAAKALFIQAGLTTPPYLIWQGEADYSLIKDKLGFPLVVKPANQGSAVGVSIVRAESDLPSALAKAREYGPVLLEKYISGRELSVGVLGEIALPVIEIIPKNEFYDYEAKYQPGGSKHIIPARLTEKETLAGQTAALQAHYALFCEGYSRVDMILKDNQVYVLEVNTLPGMTALSLLPDEARAVGIDFNELVKHIVLLGLKK